MILNRKLNFVVLLLCLFFWIYFILSVPTLDFDESLYRSVAQSMKQAKNPWLLAWDGKPLFHKPPVYYWLITLGSIFLEGISTPVSAVAARLPSFFASIGILIYLYLSGKRFENETSQSIGKNSVLSFLCGLFPVVTATSVLFDPLQTLCLMPALVIPTLLFFHGGKLKKTDWLLWSLSLFAASAVKGLNGIIIPTLAFGLHSLFSIRKLGFSHLREIWIKFFIFCFLPAVFFTSIFYIWLDFKLGRAFTHEFLWIQHIERSSTAMEQHSGPFFYHLQIIFLGGGLLIPVLLNKALDVKASFFKYGFPLTYVISFIFVFGFSATKLPHYSWPVWPALALYLGLIFTVETPKKPLSFKILRGMSHAPVILIGMLSLGFAFIPISLISTFTQSRSFLGVMIYFSGFNSLETAAFLASALLCLIYEFQFKKLRDRLELSALFTILISTGLTVGIHRTLTELMVTPFYQISDALKSDGAKAASCIRYAGALSPTFSLALAPTLKHNRCEPVILDYLVAPVWKAAECEERGFKKIDQKSYLVLCKHL